MDFVPQLVRLRSTDGPGSSWRRVDPGARSEGPGRARRKSRRLVAWLLILAFSVGVSISAEERAFTFFTSEEGLSQLVVRAVVQDSRGYLWIGTEAGLNRFDGESFEVFGIRDGLADDHVRGLAVHPDGSIWVAAVSGVSRWRESGVDTYGPEQGLPATGMHDVAITLDGEVWVGADDGLFQWRSGVFEDREAPGGVLGGPGTFERRQWLGPVFVSALHAGRGGELYVASARGLFAVGGAGDEAADGDEQGVLIEPRGNAEQILDLAEDREGRLWAVARGRLDVFADGKRIASYGEQDGFVGLDQTSEPALGTTRAGEVFVGTTGGVHRYIEGRPVESLGREQGLDLIHVHAILEDREGILWLGGYGGLARFIGRAFTTYTREDGLPSSTIRAILRDREERLWIGTAEGVAVRDEAGWRSYGTREGLSDPYVLDMSVDLDGTLYIATPGGIDEIREGRIHPCSICPEGFYAPSVQLDSSSGELWMAGAGIGPMVRSGDRLEVVAPEDNTFTDPRLFVDTGGTLYISGDRGLSRRHRGRWQTFRVADGLAADRPYWIESDGEGGVWFGYHSSVGITHFDGRSFETFTTADGLANDAVYSVGLAPDGDLWVGTARGVDRFDGSTFRHYGKAEGYPGWESNAGGFFVDLDDTLWFGTAEGLGHYEPRFDPTYEEPLRLEIRSLSVGGIAPGGDARASTGATLRAAISVRTSINRTELDLRYRLLGLAEQWHPLRGSEIEIPNLGAGRYTLEVEGRRYGEPWLSVRSEPFAVSPPWWSTPGFVAAASLGLALIMFAAVRLRTAHLAARNLRLESEVARRTRESDQARQAAEAANRAKSEFLAHMSHEIRTPLNAIVGLTSVLAEAELADRQREQVESIEHSSRLLLSLISNILDFSRIETGKIELEEEVLDLHALVEDAVRQVRSEADSKGLRLSTEIEESVPRYVLGDPTRWLQILWNLMGNAIKFTSEGRVDVRVTTGESAGGASLVMEVADTGIGISPDRLAAIFESFRQADSSTTREFGGTGLGLAIARRLVGLHGGEIAVESEPSVGSTFRVTLPLRPASPPYRTHSEGQRPGRGDSRVLEVLVADDNPMNRVVAETLLEELGHRIRLVDDGRQAVEAVAAQSFDLVLMDVHMPVIDGLEACREIRRLHGADLPVLALTADVVEGAEERCLEAGMNGVIPKPVRLETLAAAIEEFCPKGAGTSSE